MNENLPEPGADGAAEAGAAPEPVPSQDSEAATSPASSESTQPEASVGADEPASPAEPAGSTDPFGIAKAAVPAGMAAEDAAPAEIAPDAGAAVEVGDEVVAASDAGTTQGDADAAGAADGAPVEPGEPVPGEPAFEEPVEPVANLEPVEVLDAGAPAPAARRQNKVAVIATIALVAVLALGGGVAIGRITAPAVPDGGVAIASPQPEGSEGTEGTESSEPAETKDPSVTPVPSDGPDLPSEGARLGRADAPVVIDYWADYQCPYCSKFAFEVLAQLYPQVEDGTVAIVHRDFAFIGPESTQAAIAVRCADREGKYWWMHDAVYAAQDGENQGAFSNDKLTAIAASIGLDTEAFGACMTDHQVLVDVLADTAEGHRTGVQSTPTVDVNGKRFEGVADVATLEAAIADVVAGATPGVLPTQAPKDDPWASTQTSGRDAGSPTAPVTVQLWMDYQSTDSAAIANELEPELRTRADKGLIKLEQKDLALLGEESVTASAAVRCMADQDGPAWLLHDILAVNAQGAGSGIYTEEVMLRVASQLGSDVQAFDTCMTQPGIAQAVETETGEGKAAGFTAGPTVVVLQGDKEIARFTDAISAPAVLEAIDALQ